MNWLEWTALGVAYVSFCIGMHSAAGGPPDDDGKHIVIVSKSK